MLSEVRGGKSAYKSTCKDMHGQEVMENFSILSVTRLAAFAAVWLWGWSSMAETPFDFLVQSRIDGMPLTYSDPLFMRRHDWGAPGVMLGYGASDNSMLWTGAVARTWSYGQQPGPFVQSNGDGGQISTIVGSKAYFWATQDSSYDGLQYL
jgi:hypothetical protein